MSTTTKVRRKAPTSFGRPDIYKEAARAQINGLAAVAHRVEKVPERQPAKDKRDPVFVATAEVRAMDAVNETLRRELLALEERYQASSLECQRLEREVANCAHRDRLLREEVDHAKRDSKRANEDAERAELEQRRAEADRDSALQELHGNRRNEKHKIEEARRAAREDVRNTEVREAQDRLRACEDRAQQAEAEVLRLADEADVAAREAEALRDAHDEVHRQGQARDAEFQDAQTKASTLEDRCAAAEEAANAEREAASKLRAIRKRLEKDVDKLQQENFQLRAAVKEASAGKKADGHAARGPPPHKLAHNNNNNNNNDLGHHQTMANPHAAVPKKPRGGFGHYSTTPPDPRAGAGRGLNDKNKKEAENNHPLGAASDEDGAQEASVENLRKQLRETQKLARRRSESLCAQIKAERDRATKAEQRVKELSEAFDRATRAAKHERDRAHRLGRRAAANNNGGGADAQQPPAGPGLPKPATKAESSLNPNTNIQDAPQPSRREKPVGPRRSLPPGASHDPYDQPRYVDKRDAPPPSLAKAHQRAAPPVVNPPDVPCFLRDDDDEAIDRAVRDRYGDAEDDGFGDFDDDDDDIPLAFRTDDDDDFDFDDDDDD